MLNDIPKQFISNGNVLSGSLEIAEGFNDFSQAIVNICVVTISFGGYFLLVWVYRYNWVSKEIVSISIDKKN